ncbi:glycosyltransferase family 2 protein [Hyphomonas sp.]|jgi:glycosyltransferase involved in cell wall biosynthesis|uniref:glycosyltransferase family 2 protein n=1 Tax=Hyphomonas sp. TaxID=87 RepID=UPI0037C0ECE8
MNPLVSVCIPCYNAAPYIGEAIESILAQSWPLIEIIVVNDGSSDASGAILDSYASSRLLVVHQDNRGQCAAANRALEVAQGDLIKFFDADDLLSPMSIEAQVQRLNGSTHAVASAQWGRFYSNDLSTFKLTQQAVWRDLPSLDWLTEAWTNAQPMMQCGLWLIPRPILERCGGWDESLTLINDFEFFSRALCHASEVLFTPEATLYYRSGITGSLSGQKSRKAMESAFHSLLKGTGHLLKRRSDPVVRLSCANVLQQFIFEVYPDHPDLRQVIQQRVDELGGSNLPIPGGPRFHLLRRLAGWKAAKRLQKLAGRA